jgi:hypothetical protein
LTHAAHRTCTAQQSRAILLPKGPDGTALARESFMYARTQLCRVTSCLLAFELRSSSSFLLWSAQHITYIPFCWCGRCQYAIALSTQHCDRRGDSSSQSIQAWIFANSLCLRSPKVHYLATTRVRLREAGTQSGLESIPRAMLRLVMCRPPGF